MKSFALAGLLAFFLTGICLSQAPELSPYAARYDASANGLSASARRSLSKLTNNSYRLSNSLEASLVGQTLAELDQSSEFELHGDAVLPLNYAYQLSGVSRASHAINYNWDAMLALSTEDGETWQIPLQDGVLDQLSYQVALRQALISAGEEQPNFLFEIVDGDEIDRHEYRIDGQEVITTPLGTLNTLKLERVRADTDGRVTEIWLARDWEYLLARLEQVNDSGLRIVLELKSAEIGGEVVRAAD